MKDRNGKTLRKGDVCVVHPRGEIVIFLRESQLRRGKALCKNSDIYSLVFSEKTYRPKPETLEIIGDVR